MEGRDILKALAQQAKNRLIGKNENLSDVKTSRFVSEHKSQIKIVLIKNNDDNLYQMVKESINSQSINPLNDIIDLEYYKTLSKEQKEKYFFEMADKYRRLKQRYENEQIKEVY